MKHLYVLVIILLCLQTQHVTEADHPWWLKSLLNYSKNDFVKRYFSEKLTHNFFPNKWNESTDQDQETTEKPTTTTTMKISTEYPRLTEKTQKPSNFSKWPYKNFIKNEQNTRATFTPASVHAVEDDPAVTMSTAQMIAMNGYPAESHNVVTEDGYILTLHRIPHSIYNNTVSHKTALLHHGLLGSSADWVIPGKEKGLPYLLADKGYDVWLANARGNTYSRAHVSRKVDSFAFWNFTFHEIAEYDLPAIIDFITNLKGPDAKINYIGHSMGTTVLFALLSTKPEYNKRLRAGFALAPVAYMSDIRSPLWLIAKFSDDLEYLFKLLGANEFLPQSGVLNWLAKHACELNNYEEVICENSLFVICGYDPGEFNRSLLPVILGHNPAGASTKTLIHYAQEIRARGKFQQFDYGREGNLKQYGSDKPPEYPLHKITLPIALLSADNDWLASEVDVRNLFMKLQNSIEHYVVPLKEFNHIDFLWAIDAPTLVYDKLFDLMTRDSNSNTVLKEKESENLNEIKNKTLSNESKNVTNLYNKLCFNTTLNLKQSEKNRAHSNQIKEIEKLNHIYSEKTHNDDSIEMQEFENEHSLTPDENDHLNISF